MTMRIESRPSSTASIGQTRSGWILSGLLALFMLADGVMRALKVDQYVDGTVEAGFKESQAPLIGIILVICTLLYLVPNARVAFLGTLLLTAYFGGAVSTMIRSEDYAPAIFPLVFAILVWVGFTLRDARMREFLTA